jgi:hypothetical protein
VRLSGCLSSSFLAIPFFVPTSATTASGAPAALGGLIYARRLPWRGVSWRVLPRCGTEGVDGQGQSRARDA